MGVQGDRRPLTSRDTRWAKGVATRLVAMSIEPNTISQASMVMALLAGGAFYLSGWNDGVARSLLFIAAALFCQLRLLCNLFDGMVAVEGGKATSDGPFWNEFPDRIADILILVGVGYGIDAPSLGWAAAALAVLTAYVRELGRANGVQSDFSGPMAKQQRMALITGAAIVSAFEFLWNGRNEVLIFALWIVVIGTALTVVRRAVGQLRALKVKESS